MILYGSKAHSFMDGEDAWHFSNIRRYNDTHQINIDSILKIEPLNCAHLETEPKGRMSTGGYAPACKSCGAPMKIKQIIYEVDEGK